MKDCGSYDEVCWLCSVKAMTIECNPREAAYKGGCVSMHTEPLDQHSAEAACQEQGGHLISIHSAYELYPELATREGARGSVHIGGQFTDGKLEWLDGSYPAHKDWTSGFPNKEFGSCVQMLLDKNHEGQWTNVECSTKQAYMCFRNGADYGPTVRPPPPKADARCPPIQQFIAL
ncbi:hypothetical protein PMAYCL1PPCAC_26082 [Pristionchus mayeri]|uniref:C-type lectin domain-containing protein n=1 Tax=Pristionchus mayeri TaxID=1317129 RepID=A0AAN5I7W0_9BILA|nr:hypothetical protein PMAYCL1PPCAC_26082 [Pristionchus mayeri]